jgi:D-arabinose 1-dehydrogenase-like Zn-dependent alcohol dehydrogenase
VAKDEEDVLSFSHLRKVKPKDELIRLEQAPASFARMASGQSDARFVIRSMDHTPGVNTATK